MFSPAKWFLANRGDLVFIAIFALVCLLMLQLNLAPPVKVSEGVKEKALVLEVDNSGIKRLGLLTTGVQIVQLEVLGGARRGERFTAQNMLLSQLELDKVFAPGDIALAGIRNDAIAGKTMVNAQDHYRIGYTIILFALFAMLLVIFGGLTGFKALLSFFFTCIVVWKLVIPLYLKGMDPIMVAFGAVAVLTAAIIFVVGGMNRKGLTAFIGSMAGVGGSCFMAMIFTRLFHINGATMPYSQTLLYAGFENLNLAEIFIGAIFLAASGAVMDLAMDVAAGMDEVYKAHPKISRNDLISSGLRIGRAVVGTMTTTLLLAYSGGFITLMMTYMAQGTLLVDIINNPYVASEIVKTIVGSFGLVLVAPFTALIGGVIIHRTSKHVS